MKAIKNNEPSDPGGTRLEHVKQWEEVSMEWKIEFISFMFKKYNEGKCENYLGSVI